MAPRRFAFDFSAWLRPLFVVIGAGPRISGVELREQELVVRMGVGFSARVARSAIRAATRWHNLWWAIGVHTNFAGTWLVNGSPRGIVMLDLDAPVRARCLGVPVRVKRLALGLEDPDGFQAELGVGSTVPP